VIPDISPGDTAVEVRNFSERPGFGENERKIKIEASSF